MFPCPNCQTRLLRIRTDCGVVWGCSACDGRAVRIDVLRRTFTSDTLDQVWSSAREGKGERKRPCPVCKRLMAFVAVPHGLRTFPLDVCTHCQFVWFDPREYEALAEAVGEPEEPTKLVDKKWKWIPAVFGMPVERKSSVLLDRPWLTWTLAATTTLVSLLAFSNLQTAILQFGLIPAQLWRYAGLTLLISFFLHGGWFHLLGNMYFLIVFGDNVEDYLGKGRYLLLLLLATLAGGLLHIALDPRSAIPLVGASGGISGLIVFYALQFPQARLLVLLRPLFFWPLRIGARTALFLWILLQFVGVWQQVAGLSHVSSLAHLGGAGVGLLFWLKARKG